MAFYFLIEGNSVVVIVVVGVGRSGPDCPVVFQHEVLMIPLDAALDEELP